MIRREKITVETVVDRPVDEVWTLWTEPEHIMKWNSASDDWCSPRAVQDLVPGGEFHIRMEARDGSAGFDFGGVYNEVVLYKRISYTLGDGRFVVVEFIESHGQTRITEIFEAEAENSLELQKTGWQSIMDHFSRYAATAELNHR